MRLLRWLWLRFFRRYTGSTWYENDLGMFISVSNPDAKVPTGWTKVAR